MSVIILMFAGCVTGALMINVYHQFIPEEIVINGFVYLDIVKNSVIDREAYIKSVLWSRTVWGSILFLIYSSRFADVINRLGLFIVGVSSGVIIAENTYIYRFVQEPYKEHLGVLAYILMCFPHFMLYGLAVYILLRSNRINYRVVVMASVIYVLGVILELYISPIFIGLL